MAIEPTRDDKFSFGLWPVGWEAQDRFGSATRASLDVVEAVHRLSDLGAYGVSFHDDDLFPFGSSAGERQAQIDQDLVYFDADAYFDGKGFGFVKLQQLFIEHLLGAR